MKTRIMCIMSLVLILLMFSIPTSAEDAFAPESSSDRRASDLIKGYSCAFLCYGKTLQATAKISTTNMADKVGISRLEIQEKRGDDWVAVKWVEDTYDYNAYDHSYTLTYTGRNGYEYQAVAKFYVKAGALSDTASKTSVIQEIPAT